MAFFIILGGNFTDMNALLITTVAFLGYLIAYRTYGRFLGHRLFKLSSENLMPSDAYNDGVDFVPTKRNIISAIILRPSPDWVP